MKKNVLYTCTTKGIYFRKYMKEVRKYRRDREGERRKRVEA